MTRTWIIYEGRCPVCPLTITFGLRRPVFVGFCNGGGFDGDEGPHAHDPVQWERSDEHAANRAAMTEQDGGSA